MSKIFGDLKVRKTKDMMSHCGVCRSNTHTLRNISYFIGTKLTTGKSAHTLDNCTDSTVPHFSSLFNFTASPDGQNLVMQL